MKYLCTGWNRTGTSTVGKMISDKGQKHATYNEELFDLLIEGKVNELLKMASEVDTADDFPFNLLFKEIKENNPDVKVIHTYVSDPKVWITRQKTLALRAPTRRLRIANLYLYGKASPFGNEEVFIERYLEHNRAVCSFFEEGPGFVKVDLGVEHEKNKLLKWLGTGSWLSRGSDRSMPTLNVSKKPFTSYSDSELNRIKHNITL